MSAIATVLLYSACWAGFGIVSGLVASRIPPRWLRRDRGPLRLRRFEEGGTFHRRHLRVHRWKDRLPEAGSLFGGVSKATLTSRAPEALDRFGVETRRAEWVHWANLAFGFSFLVWTPRDVALLMIAFGVVAHGPFIVVQRHNRARLGRLRGRASEPAPRRSRRRRILVALLVVPVAVLGTRLTILAPDPAREVTPDEARSRFEDEAGTVPPAEVLDLPAPGVYRYRGHGTETLDRPPVDQRQGPDMPGTVIHLGDGCWSFRIDYSTNHSQTWTFCREGGDLVEKGGGSTQVLDLRVIEVSVESDTVCDDATILLPAGETPSDETAAPDGTSATVDQGCTATVSSTDEAVRIEGPTDFVGREDLRIGTAAVTACHLRHERIMTGGQTGEEVLDLWLDCRTGLPLRNERRVRARTTTPIGTVSYTEEGRFDLLDLEPEFTR